MFIKLDVLTVKTSLFNRKALYKYNVLNINIKVRQFLVYNPFKLRLGKKQPPSEGLQFLLCVYFNLPN